MDSEGRGLGFTGHSKNLQAACLGCWNDRAQSFTVSQSEVYNLHNRLRLTTKAQWGTLQDLVGQEPDFTSDIIKLCFSLLSLSTVVASQQGGGGFDSQGLSV